MAQPCGLLTMIQTPLVAYNASTQARNVAFDISLGTGTWTGGASDGTTLWFIDLETPDTAYAYNAATRNADATRNIAIGNAGWGGVVSDRDTLWFINDNTDTAVAYNASTQARNTNRDITLGDGQWIGGASDGTTLWFIDNVFPDAAYAYTATGNATVTTGGSTYTTATDADGFVSEALTGIANNAAFVIALGGQGFVEVYPQC